MDRSLPQSSANPALSLGSVILAMTSICLGATFAKTLFPVIGPAGTTALRLSLAAVMLSLALRVWRFQPTRQAVVAAISYGLAMAGMNLLFYMAIQRIPLGIALAIEFTGPLGLALFYSRAKVDLAWSALAVLGLGLLLSFNAHGNSIDLGGALLALGAGGFWAAYIVFGQRAGAACGRYAPALGMIVASFVALPFGVVQAGSQLLHPTIISTGLLVALLSSAIPYTLEMFALRRLPAKSFSILTSAEPAVGAIVGTFFLGEMLSATKWLGIAAIVVASLGTTLISNRPSAKNTD